MGSFLMPASPSEWTSFTGCSISVWAWVVLDFRCSTMLAGCSANSAENPKQNRARQKNCQERSQPNLGQLGTLCIESPPSDWMAWMNEWVDVRKCTSSIVIGAEKVGKISEDCGKPVSLEPCSLACFPFAYTFCSAVSTFLCIPKNSVVVGPCIHSGSSTQSRCFFSRTSGWSSWAAL